MRTKFKDKPETYSDMYQDLTDVLHRMGKWLSEDKHTWCLAEHARFLGAGGCPTCHGRGWIVAWDTMDCMDGGYAEYGTCSVPGCTADSRKVSGLDLSAMSKYDQNRGLSIQSMREETASWKEKIAPTQDEYNALSQRLKDIHRMCEPKKGDKVVLVRGRPKYKETGDVMPVGSISFVAYAKEGRILLKLDWEDRGADGVWTTSHNLEVVVPENM